VTACTDCHDSQTEAWSFTGDSFPSDKWTFVEDADGIKRNASSIGGIAVSRIIPHHVHWRFIDDIHSNIEISLRFHIVILAILSGS